MSAHYPYHTASDVPFGDGDPPEPLNAEALRRAKEQEAREASDPKKGTKGKGNAEATKPEPLTAIPLSAIEMRSIKWFDKPLWQLSAFTLLAGVKGSGKGTYLAALAARFTQAGENVLFIASEDSVAIDLKPRLVAAGAVIERCHVIQRHIYLPGDVDRLRDLTLEIGGAGLFIIDPVANHIGDRNSNADAEVRNAVAPLNKLADDLGCLLIGVRHPGKDRSRGALASILGSTAWVDTPRSVVMIAIDDEDPDVRHIQVVAGNRSRNGSAQAFRIEAVEIPGLAEPITRAVPLGESAKSVDDLLREAAQRSRAERASPESASSTSSKGTAIRNQTPSMPESPPRQVSAPARSGISGCGSRTKDLSRRSRNATRSAARSSAGRSAGRQHRGHDRPRTRSPTVAVTKASGSRARHARTHSE